MTSPENDPAPAAEGAVTPPGPPAGPPPVPPADPWLITTPRVRWIAPQRRTAVIVIAVVGAILCLGLGAVAGAAIGGHHDRHERVVRLFPGYGGPNLPNGPFGRHQQPLPPPGRQTPAPSPSSS